MSDIVERLKDLHKQATVERSHYYVGKCVSDSVDEIERLRAENDRLRSALEPFASDIWARDTLRNKYPDNMLVPGSYLTVGDFRNAARTLAETKDGG